MTGVLGTTHPGGVQTSSGSSSACVLFKRFTKASNFIAGALNAYDFLRLLNAKKEILTTLVSLRFFLPLRQSGEWREAIWRGVIRRGATAAICQLFKVWEVSPGEACGLAIQICPAWHG